MNSKLLEGTGKGLRHIKIREMKDIKKRETSKLLKEAPKLLKEKFATTGVVEI